MASASCAALVGPAGLVGPDSAGCRPDPASQSGRSIRVIGYSPGARAVLVLILVEDEDRLVAASAWRANASHQGRYVDRMDR